MEKKTHAIPRTALLLIAIMAVLLFGSVWNDAATFDERAHIPAGFGNITQGDYRLNMIHPPLIKALSALSAKIFVNPYFPTDTFSWRDDPDVERRQWEQGTAFLYQSGNNADRIIFWSRVPIILLTVLFGALLFWWARRRFGFSTAFLALLLFVFSPTFLTHARYVTTDLGAAFGFFIGIISYLSFLEKQTSRKLVIAGLLFGVAELIKFSLILLIPIYGVMLIGWILSRPHLHWHERIKDLWRVGIKTAAIFVIGFLLVWVVYTPFTWNYPQDLQIRDATTTLATYGTRTPVNFTLTLIENPVTRPFGQYLFGVLMAQQRAAGGNTTYFLGEVSAEGFPLYFPLLYLTKEPLALHILTLIALGFLWHKIRKKQSGVPWWERMRAAVQEHFFDFSALVFLTIYWTASLTSALNIGIRHVLPTFPFIYILVSRQISNWLTTHQEANPHTWGGWLHNIYQIYIKALPKIFLVALLLIWMALGTIATFPHFMSYYNELGGGAKEGYRIAVDSNYDWGQDLTRLKAYMTRHHIEKIALHYFGGGEPTYYLDNTFEPWWSSRGPAAGWFAISASVREGSWGRYTHGLSIKPEDTYEWLKPYQPVARAGQSIFIYKLP